AVRKIQVVVIHEDDLHLPLAGLPYTPEPHVPGHERLSPRVAARCPESAPELTDLVDDREINPIRSLAVCPNRKRGIHILLVVLVCSGGRRVSSPPFGEQLMGETRCGIRRIFGVQSGLEIERRPLVRKVGGRLVQSKRSGALKYALAGRGVCQELDRK